MPTNSFSLEGQVSVEAMRHEQSPAQCCWRFSFASAFCNLTLCLRSLALFIVFEDCNCIVDVKLSQMFEPLSAATDYFPLWYYWRYTKGTVT
jgi:hypothetical protein